MGFWDKIKNLRNQINQVENTVYYGNRSYAEVYEKNAQLESEIAARTRELDTANKQMVTLQHIWEMMNSSKPLSSVLTAVVNNLQGELGYLHSCIAKKMLDEKGEFYQILACSGELFGENFYDFFKCDPLELRLAAPDLNDLKGSISSNKIYLSRDIRSLAKSVIPEISDEYVDKAVSKTRTKSYMFVPLKYKGANFGSLVVFSSRDDATENELNFLKLFAKQIELAITIADLFQVVKEQAITDGMTGLYNRRYFEEVIKKEAIRSDRQHQKFSVIGLDLDHLKQINDVYGHNYGDIAIKAIANVLQKSGRSIDIAARMGGEEFNIILPGIDAAGAMVAAERIRKLIEDLELEKIEHITASLGVGTFPDHSEDLDELLELVDHAMYESKRNGRNQVTLAKQSAEVPWQEVAIETFIDLLSKKRIPIDTRTSRLLNKKLSEMNINNDMIYQVADTLVTTYNPEHQEGATKRRMFLASLLAKRFDIPKDSVDKLKIAFLLYDIGNTMLPKDLLNKKEPLNDEDILQIKKHPLIAAREILEPIANIVDVIPIIEKHHENWNGTGYPNKISGDDIPIESQIILIVDSYFALMENRPYRRALTKEEAVKTIMSEANSKWSLKLAKEFESIVREDLD